MIFLGFFFVIHGKIREQNLLNEHDQYVQLADLIEKEVLLASKSNFGYLRAFTLPNELNNEPYRVVLEDGTAFGAPGGGTGGDTLVITGTISGTEYVRFLSVKLFFQDAPSDGVYSFPTNGAPLILEKREVVTQYVLLVRNDCSSLEKCS